MTMSQIRDQILQAIVHAPSAWISPFAIGEAVQCPPDIVQDCLSDLEAEGFVSTWENKPGELVVTLTPYGAEKLEVHIVEWGSDKCHWASINERPPTQFRRVFGLEDKRNSGYALTPSDLPSPEEQAIANEEIGVISVMTEEKRKSLPKTNWQGIQRFDEFSLPYPTVLLGQAPHFGIISNIRHARVVETGNSTNGSSV